MKVFNPVIIAAILVQSFISRGSRIAGAVAGFAITTGILFWGLSVYDRGNQIAFAGFPISEGFFLLSCMVWYGFDVKGFLGAQQASQRESANRAILQEPAVRAVWSATWKAWMAGKGTPAGMAEAKRLSQDAFVNAYIRKTGRYMKAITARHAFEPNEFIVYAALDPAHDLSLLTDRTLYLLGKGDPNSAELQIIPLREIETYHFDTKGQGRVHIELRTGRRIDQQRNAGPKDEFVRRFVMASRERGATPDSVGEAGMPFSPNQPASETNPAMAREPGGGLAPCTRCGALSAADLCGSCRAQLGLPSVGW